MIPSGYSKIHCSNLVVGKQYFFRWPKVGEALVKVTDIQPGDVEAEIVQGEFRFLGRRAAKAGEFIRVDDGDGIWYEAEF